MKRRMRTAITLLCIFVTLIPTFALADSSDAETAAAYNYVEFGSYPQTEVVSQASDSGVYGKNWGAESDYIIDADLYNTLKNLSDDQWNANGDASVGGNKYRRIKAGNATANSSGEANSYDWSSSDTYHYFKYEPIKWRILEQDSSGAFLLSEIALDDQMYNTNITGSLTWETSTIRSWLNGYDGSKNAYGTDYSNKNFIDTAFTAEEQSKIKTTALENKDNSKSGTEGGNDTNDKIYLLCEDEVYGSTATGYGFASNYSTDDTARQSKSSTYAKAMGIESNDLGRCFWWLRSPGSYPGLFTLVRDGGNVFRGGQHANSKSRGVRPALRVLPLSEVICSGYTGASLSSGTLQLSIGGNALGEFTFASSGSGWSIKDSQGRYLSFSDGSFSYSGQSFSWDYQNGSFTTSVTTAASSSNFISRLLDSLFGRKNTTTTVYYLLYTDGFAVSTASSGSQVSFKKYVQNTAHSFGAWTYVSPGTHTRVCSVCNAVDRGECVPGTDGKCTICKNAVASTGHIDISVLVTSAKESYGGIFGRIFGLRRTVWSANISAVGVDMNVSRVEYSTDQVTWYNGTSLTSTSEIKTVYVRAYGDNGEQFDYTYSG